MATVQRLVLALVLALVVVVPARADYLDVGTEQLDDGWTRYTYTLHEARGHDLRSLVLTGDYFDGVRALKQPADWMGYVVEGVLSWGRDVRGGALPETLVFSFESQHLPGVVMYRLTGDCLAVRGSVTGPGPEIGTPAGGIRTPEPGTLGLLSLGGGCWWLARRWRREPA